MDLIVAHFLALNIMAERWSVVGQSTAKHRGSHFPCCGHACMHLRSTQKGNSCKLFPAKVASSDSKSNLLGCEQARTLRRARNIDTPTRGKRKPKPTTSSVAAGNFPHPSERSM